MLSFRAQSLVLYSLLALSTNAADCQCGFSVNSTTSYDSHVFTQYLETDFTKRAAQGQWIAQNYIINATMARGPYGKNASSKNVVYTDEGLQLWARQPIGDYIPMAEVDSKRTDMLYGSFRIRAKMGTANGTCGAMFWYWNNTQEIDMEFLSSQYKETDGSNINLVIQSPESQANGYDAANTSDFAKPHLPYRPDQGFHEYRFDWMPDQVSFYADGVLLHTMTENIPDHPGHMVFNHWSNGDPGWSAGPPEEDTYLTISQAYFYFNTTAPKATKIFSKNCPRLNTTQVCEIQSNITAPLMPPESFSSFLVKVHTQTIYIVVGVVIGLVIIGFIGCMMTIRFWNALKDRILQAIGLGKPKIPTVSEEPGADSRIAVKTPDVEMDYASMSTPKKSPNAI